MDFPSHFEQIFQQLNYQRVHGQLCDCVIVVGSRHFKAHRSVLAACSTHFRALFTVADGDASMNMIQLDSEVVTAEAFAALVDMMYTSTLMLGASNVMDVLLAASHLHLNTVVKACKHYLTTRTLPASPSAERPAHLHHQQQQQQHHLHHHQDHQRHRQQQADLAASASLAANASANVAANAGVSASAAAASSAATSRLQRSFLLQQLGLSLVSSALGGMEEEDVGLGGVVSGAAAEQRAPFPGRRFHKRKPSLGGLSEEGRPRQRARPSAPARALLGAEGGGGDMAEGPLLSPDSQKMGDDSKLDTSMAGLGGVSQEDPQMPSQSDSGRCEGEESGGVRKEEYMEEGDHRGDRVGAKVKSGTEEEEEEEVQEEKVVVKREPLSSPEAADETSDMTSDPAEPGGQEEEEEEEEDKVKLSPESSGRSFICDPEASSGTHLLHGNGLGGGAAAASGGATFDCGGSLTGKSGFSISGFLDAKGFAGVARDNDDDLPNTTTGEAAAHHFLLGPEAGSAGVAGRSSSSSSSLLRPGSLHGEGGGGFGDALQAESLFLHPLRDGLGSPQGGGGGLDPFALDFQRSSLGLHSLARASRGGQAAAAAAAAALGYPGYRRIAPKMASCISGAAGSAVLQDPASSSTSFSSISSLGGPVLPGDGGGASRPTSLPPQLTRASADVLSKCKKALSEHNVLVVEGARKYACRICCKTFLTLTDCKKHIRVHTGEKPYACLKCGKRFSQSSHLYKHSKTTCLRWQNSNVPSALL